MLFVIKKLVGAMLMPFELSVAILAIGTVLLWWERHRHLAKWMITAGCGLLLVFSSPLIGYHLVHSLEARYRPLSFESSAAANASGKGRFSSAQGENSGTNGLDVSGVQLIVVLSGGASDDPSLPGDDRLTPSSALRVVAAVQIYLNSMTSCTEMLGDLACSHTSTQVIAPKIVLSGGPTLNREPEALPMGRLAELLGVPARDIILETRSRDTFSEAVDLLPIIGQKRFILVTSAIQMPRAMALFHHLGMHPIPAPTNFSGQRSTGPLLKKVIPSVTALDQSSIAIHEQVGMLWECLRGEL